MPQSLEELSGGVTQYEAARRAALIGLDRKALGALLAPDLVWTHANGGTDTRTSYLEKLGAVRFEAITPLSEDVLVLEGTASIKSVFAMRLRLPDDKVLELKTTASAVWTRQAGGAWVLRRFHSGNFSE